MPDKIISTAKSILRNEISNQTPD